MDAAVNPSSGGDPVWGNLLHPLTLTRLIDVVAPEPTLLVNVVTQYKRGVVCEPTVRT
jgi:hypothetical protein